MPSLVFMLLLLAMAGHSSATWCVCKDLDTNTLQKTLDYACGAGADCNPTHQNQPCFQPNTVRAHCSYAVNSYYQKHGQQPIACEFAGSATISPTDPSIQGCAYPATARYQLFLQNLFLLMGNCGPNSKMGHDILDLKKVSYFIPCHR
ncbi:plasmodesmata callose-binding protein 3 [Phtheirospermum japonicum]|uniref:Plasmodesmata callose-binding protein 3 n=1 Tax=Phtheirospermum japonicum TaxID=374723 RepID=A0A830C6M4_9LAMI|nr:plasmodesmata callose-binding protein 3 [Phtheirospermum japonicum]